MDKKAYKEKLEAQINEWQAEVNKLKAQAEKHKAEGKIKYQEKINSLEHKLQQHKNKLKALQEAGEEKWEDLKKEIDKESNEIKAQLKDIFS